MARIVLDASAAVELLANTTVGTAVAQQLPPDPVFWVPDGLFDAEVLTVWRRWDLRSDIASGVVDAARRRFITSRFRQVSVRALSERAWSFRHSVSFTDACYVTLAELLECPLATNDLRLVGAPSLPVPTIHVKP